MGWRDRLRPASFRGVPFKVEGHDHDLGRRIEVHQYAQRDLPWPEDLGRAARRFRVDAYVIGENYDQERDALRAALEKQGPGELVHPWLGRHMVALESARLREDSDEAGQAVFSLDFVEDGGNVAPSVTEATQATARAAATGAATAAASQFGATFSVGGMPGFVLTEADQLNGAMADQLATIGGLLAPAGNALDAFRRRLATFRSNSLALAGVPADLASSALDLVHDVRMIARTPAAALEALKPLLRFGSTLSAVLGGTPARARQRTNQAAYLALVRRAAAAEAVAAIAELTFDSYQAAVAVRDEVSELIDQLATEAADAGEDDAFLSMRSLRLVMIRDVTARGGSLSRLFSYVPTTGEPALVTAHRLYGDADRADEIVARNGIAHPGFLPAGRTLEVLAPDGGQS